jgi:hypothetical protein
MRFELEWFEGKPLPPSFMFCAAVWAFKAHWIGPDER